MRGLGKLMKLQDSYFYQMTLKHELLQTAATLGLSTDDFRAIGITEWEPIMKRIEDKFVSTRYNASRWWWDGNFKGSVHAIVLPDHPFEVVDKLIPPQEQVWFIAEEQSGQDKLWLFEGNIKAIQQVLIESCYFEHYIVSKKYEWLLCENHHGVLYGVGDIVIEKLKQMEQELAK